MFKDTLVLSIINVISSAASYILTIYLMRTLGIEEFGYYSYLMVFSSYCSIMITFGTEQTAARTYFNNNQNSRILIDIFLFRALMLAICMLLFALFNDWKFVLGLTALSLPNLGLSYGYEVRDKNHKYALIFLCERISFSILVFVLFNLVDTDLIIVFSALIIVSTTSLIYQFHDLCLFREIIARRILPVKCVLTKNINITIATLALLSYGGGSRIMLEYHYGYSALALYSAAWQFVMLSTLFQTQVEKFLRPKIMAAKKRPEDRARFITEYLNGAFIPMLFFSFLTFTFGPDLLVFVAGAKYEGSEDLIKIFSLYFLVISADSFSRILSIRHNLDSLYKNIHVVFAIVLILALLTQGKKNIETFAIIVCATHMIATITTLVMLKFIIKRNNHEAENPICIRK